MTLTLRRIREANARRQLQWQTREDGTFVCLPVEYRGNELAGEVGELCNLVKKIAREGYGIRGSRAERQQVARECHDVLICLDLLANSLGVDLTEATIEGFNAVSEREGLAERLEPDDDVARFQAFEAERDALIARVAARHGPREAAKRLGISERSVFYARKRERDRGAR